MMIRGRTSVERLWARRMKCDSIFSVISKSAITPSFIGRIATMLPGVRPSISLASLADRLDLAGDPVDRHDRRLRDDDALALGVDQRVRGAEVDREVARQEAQVDDGTKIHQDGVLLLQYVTGRPAG